MIDYKDSRAVMEVCEKATKGPWEWRVKKEIPVNAKDKFFGFFVGDLSHPTSETSSYLVLAIEENGYGQKDIICFKNEDKDLIALSREALPYYVVEVERLRTEKKTILESMKNIKDYFDNPDKYGGTWPEFFSASIKQFLIKSGLEG